MKTSIVLFGALAAILAGALGWVVFQNSGSRPNVGLASVDIESGQALYGEYCAVCHGANLEGQPDWQSPDEDGRLPAPPHDESGHTWHHADSLLFEYAKFGGKVAMANLGIEFDSAMPGFDDELSDEDLRNILAFIKSTWPEQIREFQAERTDEENELEGN